MFTYGVLCYLKEGGENIEFSERLREHRKLLGITAKDFATQIGLAYTTYISYETTNKKPPIENLIKIATALHVSVDELLGRAGGEAVTNQKRLDYWERYLKSYKVFLTIDHEKQQVYVHRREGDSVYLLAPGIQIPTFLSIMDKVTKDTDSLLADTRGNLIALLLQKEIALMPNK